VRLCLRACSFRRGRLDDRSHLAETEAEQSRPRSQTCRLMPVSEGLAHFQSDAAVLPVLGAAFLEPMKAERYVYVEQTGQEIDRSGWTLGSLCMGGFGHLRI
jgi:hypothetical protein